jgi:hypothetical protein
MVSTSAPADRNPSVMASATLDVLPKQVSTTIKAFIGGLLTCVGLLGNRLAGQAMARFFR